MGVRTGQREQEKQEVTSTGKAGGAGVRAGCSVRSINGTPTAHLSLSHAHALTKQASTLALEIEDNTEEPAGNHTPTPTSASNTTSFFSSSTSVCSNSSSATSASTVVAANGHINSSSSSRRRKDSGGSTGDYTPKDAWAQDATTDPDKSASEDSDSSVIILETYGVDPSILRGTEGGEGETITKGSSSSAAARESTTSSLNLSYLGGYSESHGSAESDETSSQTDTSTDTLVYEETRHIGGLVCPIEGDVALTQAAHTSTEQHPVRTVAAEQEDHRSLPQHTSSKETLPEYDKYGAFIKYPTDNSDDDEDDKLIRSPTLEDLSSLRESNDSIFDNFQEELERVERQYPNLRPEHLLSKCLEEEEVVLVNPQWMCETIREGSRWSTIIEEGEEEEEENEEVEKREEEENSSCGTSNGNLDSVMGQYYSSTSVGEGSKSEISGSVASSPRSSEGWRMSLASTATVGSSATAGSDDTVAKDMSELSSVNSRLSYLDEDQEDGKGQSASPEADPSSTITKVVHQPEHKRQTSIKDAIDELESIEQAAQTLLQKRQLPGEDDRLTPVSDKESQPGGPSSDSLGRSKGSASPLSKKKFSPSPPLTRKIIEEHTNKTNVKIESELKTTQFQTTSPKIKEDITFPESKSIDSSEPPLVNGSSTQKGTKTENLSNGIPEVKPPLPPAVSSQQAKPEIRRRQWSKSKELQPYISRESYNDERVLKELERLRRSYQESDLNDFLDALENTAISDEIEEAFLRQLLQDISEDVEKSPSEAEDSKEVIMTETVAAETKTTEEIEVPTEQLNPPSGSSSSSSSSSKFERVKERILEMITVRKAGRESGNQDRPITPRDTQSDSSHQVTPQVTPQVSRSATPQSFRADTPDSKPSRSQTPDIPKGEEGKKGFNIADFLKKGSPKYLRKKYKERKNRKSDLITTSESESEDPDVHKKETDNTQVPKKECQSSLKGSNRSLNASQELKKEVRFDLDEEGQRKGLEDYNDRNTRNNSLKATVTVEEEIPKSKLIIAGPQLITFEAQQQETVILRETMESTQDQESDSSYSLPSTVEEINSKAESLLPKLPERIRPPRRKKKMIPTTVEDLSSEDQSDTSASSTSFKGGDARVETLKTSSATKDESPPPLPPYEEILVVPKTETKEAEGTDKNVSESKTSGEPIEVTKIESPSPPAEFSDFQPLKRPPRTLNPFDSDYSESEGEVTLDTREKPTYGQSPDTNEVLKQDGPAGSISESVGETDILVAPIPVTSVASISVAPRPEEAKMMYPPRTLPLPVIQESLHEDQVSLPTPSEPTVSFSSSRGGSGVCEDEENFPSLYDNVNPYKEVSQEKSEINQEYVLDKLIELDPLQEPINESMKVKDSEAEPQEPIKDEGEVSQQDLPQAACKSPEEKAQRIDFEALEAITAEMFRFTESVDTKNRGLGNELKKIDGKSITTVVTKTTDPSVDPKNKLHGSVHEPVRMTSPRPVQPKPEKKWAVMKDTATGPDTAPMVGSVREAAKSNTIGIQTDSTRYVRMYEAASQTDTEYETDFDTESEIEETTKVKYDASKWVFGPSREQTMAQPSPRDPQLQELHRQQQRMIKELQQQKIMQQRKQEEQPSTPSEEKMPLKVVRELKNVLSELDAVTPAPVPATALVPTPAPAAPARPPPPAVPRKPLESNLGRDSEKTWQTALQELGLDESTLLSEIEQILGFGSLSSKPRSENEASSSSRPVKFEKPVKLEKPEPHPTQQQKQKPVVPERDSSRGVWSPGKSGGDQRDSGPSKIELPDLPSFKDQPSVWSPTRAGSASPSLGRRGEYRKVTYEGQTNLQKRPSQENVSIPRAEESYAWKDFSVDKVTARSPTSALPKVQNPTVTLLQKKREGQIPGKRPEYLKPDDVGPKYKPDDKLYVIKREYESEDESGGRRFAVLGPKKVSGVGPTTSDGVPVTLKSGIKSEHQGEWYKRMFDSLHKIKDDEHIIVRYKVPKARYGGYMSEPEGYDSDVGSSRYATLDYRRPLYQYQVDPMTSSLPRECLIDLDPYSRNTSRYVHQPGRIEDYVPGYSSLSEKELKRNPELEVKLESKSQEPPASSANHRIGSQMSMTHALKESGYESDSTLVFKKREDARRQAPDPRKTSQVYRQIQRGGDIPFTGLQKPNPPRPREPLIGPLPFSYLASSQKSPPPRPESPYKYESGEVNIHYRTPVRIEQKEAIPEEELARRQEEHMKKVYENERRKKYLAELEDIERRRHTDNFTPLQKSPIPLNRYDDESSLGTLRGGARTPDVKQVARALYNFTAQNKRELTFNKGDVVFIRRQIDKNWYEGELRGSVGIFPCNYVEIVPYENVKTMSRKATEGQARARFNFQAQTSMEMSLSKGELVVLTRRVDENWYEGRIGNRKGIFPVSYVDTLVEPGSSDRPMSPSSSPLPRPALPAATLLYNGASSYSSPYSTLGRPGSQNDGRPYQQSLTVNTQQEPVPYRALYNYKPQNDDELELFEGDVVMVMEKCDDGWFVGTSRRTGLFGTFPGNYVEKV